MQLIFWKENTAMKGFEQVDITAVSDNFFERIGSQWTLITAGTQDKFNTMTASWGGTGVLWNRNVVFSFIRDSRYTLEFVDGSEYYTLSFFGGEYMKELAFCGRNSGRDVDKIAATGLTPVFDREAPYFEQADLVLVCRKLYKQRMQPECFIDRDALDKWYGDNDFHEVFVGEIVAALKRS